MLTQNERGGGGRGGGRSSYETKLICELQRQRTDLLRYGQQPHLQQPEHPLTNHSSGQHLEDNDRFTHAMTCCTFEWWELGCICESVADFVMHVAFVQLRMLLSKAKKKKKLSYQEPKPPAKTDPFGFSVWNHYYAQ